MRRRSRFVYGPEGSTTTWDTALPVMLWTPADDTVGGWRDSAAGVPASYVVRRDALLEMTLRVEEPDLVHALNLIAWGQSAQPILWTPDPLEDPDTTVPVYLVTPAPGSRWSPTRSTEYPRMFEVAITLRGVGTAMPWRPYFGAD